MESIFGRRSNVQSVHNNKSKTVDMFAAYHKSFKHHMFDGKV
jgi:hypothetical protein